MSERTRQAAVEGQQVESKELLHQITYGNGRATEETRGMTLRELVLDVREDVKQLKEKRTITTGQFAAFMSAYSMLLVMVLSLFASLG